MGNRTGLNYPAPNFPFAFGISGSILTYGYSFNSAGYGISRFRTQDLIGLSGDYTYGNSGVVELGYGARHLGAGLNLDSTGAYSGFSLHYGYDYPIGGSPVYGTLSIP